MDNLNLLHHQQQQVGMFSLSSGTGLSDSEFVANYLINSCGLSENRALTVSKQLKFNNTSQLDSVITLLEHYGFTKPYISKLITKCRPSFLLSDPVKTLKPKLDFFISKGLHGIELADFISTNPQVLTLSLNTQLIPSFDILKGFVSTDTNVIKILKRSSWILNVKVAETLRVNLELLRCEGVLKSTVSNYLINKPRSFTVGTDEFRKIVEKLKEMGFRPSRITFMVAIGVLTSMSEDTWKTKVDVYKIWGLFEDQIQTAFKNNPLCMMVSEKKIKSVMKFLVKEMGYDALSILESPVIIKYRFKERIVPRCHVINILVSKGLIQEKIPLTTLSEMTGKSFSENFVEPYEKEAPELMKVFQGKLSLPKAFSEMKDLKR